MILGWKSVLGFGLDVGHLFVDFGHLGINFDLLEGSVSGSKFLVFDGFVWAPRSRLRSFEVHLRLLVVNCWPLGVNVGLNESILGLRVDIGYLGII